MRALGFLVVILCACGPSPTRTTTTVEIQPLPTVTTPVATASATPPPIMLVAQRGDADVALDELRDPRRARSQRSTALLVTETQALDQLLTNTAMSSPDRPALMRRLAENFAELRRGGQTQAGASAIRYYDKLWKSYAQYPQLDEVLYFLGLEYEANGDLTNARRIYYELIKTAPSSKYVPSAYFAFGVLFAREANVDPTKWQFVLQAMMEVIKFSQTPLAPEAWYMMMLAYNAQGETARAMNARQKIRRDYPQSPTATRSDVQ